VCWKLFRSLCVTVKPVIAYSSPRVESITGRDVNLTCVVLAGNPAPTIVWTRVGVSLNSTSRVVDDGSGDLYLENVNIDDEGEYVCTAINVGGTASSSVNLDVLGSFVIGPHEIH